MAYAQKNYMEMIGRVDPRKPVPLRYRIEQTGCFLVSFANLATERLGIALDPLELNRRFRDWNIYTDIDDGVLDDLGWQSITAAHSDIVVTSIGRNGWPQTNNAIVKFAYISPRTNQWTTHFSLVADYTRGLILDSWDGQVRAPGYYGQPVEWATFGVNKPQPVTVATPALNIPADELVTVQDGWGVSHAAKHQGFTDFGSEERWNDIARKNGVADYTKLKLIPGQVLWVGKPAPATPTPPPPAPTPQPVVVPQVDPLAWQGTYKEFEQPEKYRATQTLKVIDQATLEPVSDMLIKGNLVVLSGTFTKGNTLYGRVRASAIRNGWVAVPMGMLTPAYVGLPPFLQDQPTQTNPVVDDEELTEEDEAALDLTTAEEDHQAVENIRNNRKPKKYATTREAVVAATASVYGFLARVGSVVNVFKKNNKE